MREPITHSLVKALRRVPAFAPLDDDTLLQIVGASANLCWSAGSLVFSKGDQGDALYLVLSGQVRIFDVAADGAEVDVGHVGPGDYFGEQSLITHTPRTRSALAVEDCEFMVLPEDYFAPLVASNAELAAYVEERIRTRGAPRASGMSDQTRASSSLSSSSRSSRVPSSSGGTGGSSGAPSSMSPVSSS